MNQTLNIFLEKPTALQFFFMRIAMLLFCLPPVGDYSTSLVNRRQNLILFEKCYRRNLAITPLPLSAPSTPSAWRVDFRHYQRRRHAQHIRGVSPNSHIFFPYVVFVVKTDIIFTTKTTKENLGYWRQLH